MKTVVILGALAFSASAFAQRPQVTVEKEINKAQTEINSHADKGQKAAQDAKDKVNARKVSPEDVKGQGKEIMDEAKEKVNNGKAYGKDKGEMTGKEFGQHRAAEAKAKAAKVKTEKEAEEMIETSKEETTATMEGVNSKMTEARQKLEEKLSKGEITKEVYEEKMKTFMDFEARKNAIIEGMK